jgi:hypothetical protein
MNEIIHWNYPVDAAFEMVCWLLENNNPYKDDI